MAQRVEHHPLDGVGELTFAVPQVRGGSFYPGALEKGSRIEQMSHLAVTCAIPETEGPEHIAGNALVAAPVAVGVSFTLCMLANRTLRLKKRALFKISR